MKITCYLKDNMSEKSKQLLQISTGNIQLVHHVTHCWVWFWVVRATLLGFYQFKIGFATTRNNDLRDLTDITLSEIWSNIKIEPKLVPLSGDLRNQTANRSNEARLYVWARRFWEREQQAFFD